MQEKGGWCEGWEGQGWRRGSAKEGQAGRMESRVLGSEPKCGGACWVGQERGCDCIEQSPGRLPLQTWGVVVELA